MTPDKISEALGPEWDREDDVWWHRTPGGMAVGSHPNGTWYVDQFQGFVTIRLDCRTLEAAVAVARLLVVAERVAGGDWVDFYAARYFLQPFDGRS